MCWHRTLRPAFVDAPTGLPRVCRDGHGHSLSEDLTSYCFGRRGWDYQSFGSIFGSNENIRLILSVFLSSYRCWPHPRGGRWISNSSRPRTGRKVPCCCRGLRHPSWPLSAAPSLHRWPHFSRQLQRHLPHEALRDDDPGSHPLFSFLMASVVICCIFCSLISVPNRTVGSLR